MHPITNKTVFRLSMLPLVLVCLLAGVFAQGLTGQISGTLNDPNGGAVPNAKVEIISQETAQVRTVT